MTEKFIANFKIIEERENGGRIRINTDAIDRDKDRVFPSGAVLDSYLKNPVVQWGHNYRDPWATIGRTLGIERSSASITVDFELRDPANESDPMNVISLLWSQGYVKTASIGFRPLEYVENETGGYDYKSWELLEWSLVPIPANQEALRLAYKGLIVDDDELNLTESSTIAKNADLSDDIDESDQDIEDASKIREIDGTLAVQGESTDNHKDNPVDDEPINDNPTNDESERVRVAEFFNELNKIIKESIS